MTRILRAGKSLQYLLSSKLTVQATINDDRRIAYLSMLRPCGFHEKAELSTQMRYGQRFVHVESAEGIEVTAELQYLSISDVACNLGSYMQRKYSLQN
jgi:hypothetical protein